MAGENPIDSMKIVLREKDIPFFSDEELQFYLSANGGNVDDALYQCLQRCLFPGFQRVTQAPISVALRICTAPPTLGRWEVLYENPEIRTE